jgi:hypothetical protein
MNRSQQCYITGLYAWSYAATYVNRAIDIAVFLCLNSAPEFIVWAMLHNSTRAAVKKPVIISARTADIDITNRMRAFLNIYWDDEVMSDDLDVENLTGGVNIKDLVRLCPSLVWIAYVFERNNDLITMSNDELHGSVKYMLVSLTNNMIFTGDKLNTSDKISYGEIAF